MKKIKIDGITFEVHKSKYAKVENLARYSGRTLSECYSTPSKAKKDIYNAWLKWAMDNDIMYFGVSGYNCNTFSLQGLLEYENNTYILQITATKNNAYIIE